jgi:hypothetical protein
MRLYAILFVILLACAVQRLATGDLFGLGFLAAAVPVGLQIVKLRREG